MKREERSLHNQQSWGAGLIRLSLMLLPMVAVWVALDFYLAHRLEETIEHVESRVYYGECTPENPCVRVVEADECNTWRRNEPMVGFPQSKQTMIGFEAEVVKHDPCRRGRNSRVWFVAKEGAAERLKMGDPVSR